MTTDKLLTTLEAALIGESSKCWVDVYVVQLAVDKIRAAEELADTVEKIRAIEQQFGAKHAVVDVMLGNYRAAGETE